jgi:two-component system response regulator AtoC
MHTILVAEDEPELRNYLGLALTCHGYHVEFAQNGEEVLTYLASARQPDISLLLLDIVMPYKGGLETLKEIRRIRPDLPVTILSGATSPANIVTAMKNGAVDFLPKPISPEDLRKAIDRVLAPKSSETPIAAGAVKGLIAGTDEYAPTTGAWSEKVERLAEMIGSSDVPVLLQGETGVGKEVLARKLHARSPRAGRQFLKLNCAALPSELVESELFGYERGAFTGAFKSVPGKFEMANGGTILLDEIGDMDFKLQAKLLQVLQDREFLRLGAKETSKVDVRVMAATHCDLEQAIVARRFREDLYYRLNIVDIHIPPLRDRIDEILPLAQFFINRYAIPSLPPVEITPGLKRALLDYDWPGNIRELENFMRKLLVLRNADLLADELRRKSNRQWGAGARPPRPSITEQPATQYGQAAAFAEWPGEPAARALKPDHEAVPPAVKPYALDVSASFSTPTNGDGKISVLEKVDSARKAAESEAIIAALNSTLWNRKKAAAVLNIDYKALLYKMKKLGIGTKPSPEDSRTEDGRPQSLTNAAGA